MARAYQNVAVQIAPETTAGTAVPANKKLLGLTLDPQASMEFQQFAPSGYRVNTVNQLVSEKTEADYDGPICFNTIVYPLSSLFGKTTAVAQATTNSAAKDWTWNFTGKGDTAIQTYSVEVGDAGRASKFAYGAFTGMELDISRTDDNTMSGSLLGQALTTGATLTASPTEVDIQPVAAGGWDVFMDTTSASIGTTKLSTVYDANLNFGDFFAEEYTLDSTKTSYASLYDAEEPSFEWSMTVGADATGEGLITAARGGQKRFIRLVNQGAVVPSAATAKYTIQIDMCVSVTEVDSYESNDGLYVLPFTFGLMYDQTWGKAMSIKVTNGLAAL